MSPSPTRSPAFARSVRATRRLGMDAREVPPAGRRGRVARCHATGPTTCRRAVMYDSPVSRHARADAVLEMGLLRHDAIPSGPAAEPHALDDRPSGRIQRHLRPEDIDPLRLRIAGLRGRPVRRSGAGGRLDLHHTHRAARLRSPASRGSERAERHRHRRGRRRRARPSSVHRVAGRVAAEQRDQLVHRVDGDAVDLGDHVALAEAGRGRRGAAADLARPATPFGCWPPSARSA